MLKGSLSPTPTQHHREPAFRIDDIDRYLIVLLLEITRFNRKLAIFPFVSPYRTKLTVT